MTAPARVREGEKRPNALKLPRPGFAWSLAA